MGIIDKSKYYEFSHILSGCRTIMDSYYFSESYTKANPETKILVMSMINGKKYENNVLDFKTMKSLIERLHEVKYRDEADTLISEFSESTNDRVQLKTFSRISKSKLIRPPNEQNKYIQNSFIIKRCHYCDQILKQSNQQYIQDKLEKQEEINTQNLVTKQCPHCLKNCTLSSDSEYTICGYINSKTGYDLVGCGKDWCFKCGKMLCKKWDIDQLFLAPNKHHDSECCKQHAKDNGRIYEIEYCQCINSNVTR